MKDHIILHKDKIKELTWNLRNLSQEQRDLARDKLMPFAGKPLYRPDLVKMLRELRNNSQISKIDYEGLSETLLKLFEEQDLSSHQSRQ